MLPTPEDVNAAAQRLTGIAARTPLILSPGLSEMAGVEVRLKCENAQRTGSFKLRGAYNALASLPADVRARGIVASSAGNHGLGVAHAARLLGMRALVFVPASAPAVKRDGILALGAEVDATQPHYDDAHAAAVAYAKAHGLLFVNPTAGKMLLAGQGTIALEILAELPDLRTIIVPVGGGGLVGGIATIVRARAPWVRILGAQTDRSNAMAASLAVGRVIEVPVPPTLADGLTGQIDDVGLATGQFALDEMRVVSEAEMEAAMAFLADAHGMRVEGAGAVTTAAVSTPSAAQAEGPIAVIVSGGNIDEATWRDAVARGRTR